MAGRRRLDWEILNLSNDLWSFGSGACGWTTGRDVLPGMRTVANPETVVILDSLRKSDRSSFGTNVAVGDTSNVDILVRRKQYLA